MNTQRGAHTYFYVALLLSLVVLPGCGVVNWVKNTFGGETKPVQQTVDFSSPMININADDSSEVLVMINGKPAITANSFERDFNVLLEENPQLKSVLPFMPEAKKNFLSGLVNQEIVDAYVRDHKLDQKIEYKQDLERLYRSVVRMLNTKYFAASHPVTVEDIEVMAYYEANKDKMQELIVSRGGIQTVGVQFEREADARSFMAKVQGNVLTDIAKAEKMSDKVKDFKLVNKQSVGMDPVLRNKIVAIERTPTTEMIKVNDKTFWVVQATMREEPKYRPFEEVREPIRQLVEREKSNEALQKAIDGLKDDMKVTINFDYFKAAETTMQAQQDAMPHMTHAESEQREAAPVARAA